MLRVPLILCVVYMLIHNNDVLWLTPKWMWIKPVSDNRIATMTAILY